MLPPIEIAFFSRSLVKKYVIIITKIIKLSYITVALRITLVVYYPRLMAAILPSIQKVFAVPRQHLTII